MGQVKNSERFRLKLYPDFRQFWSIQGVEMRIIAGLSDICIDCIAVTKYDDDVSFLEPRIFFHRRAESFQTLKFASCPLVWVCDRCLEYHYWGKVGLPITPAWRHNNAIAWVLTVQGQPQHTMIAINLDIICSSWNFLLPSFPGLGKQLLYCIVLKFPGQ